MCRKAVFWVFACALVSAPPASAELVGWWRLDEGSGTTAYDLSGRGNDGIVVGGAEWVDGQYGSGLLLDGTSGHVAIPSFSLTTDTITYSAWINGWKAVDWAGIVGSRVGGGAELIFGNNDTVHYVWNGPEWGWADGPVIPQDEWAMVALAIEPAKATAYVYTPGGGLSEATNEVPHTGRTVGALNIGWAEIAPDSTRFFRGIVDEVRVYDTALTGDELLAALAPATMPYAYGGMPKGGAVLDATSVDLTWVAGDLAVSHDVYFGESFEEVEQAGPDSDAFVGNQTDTTMTMQDLTPGTTYYWRVDEVDDTNPNSPWKGPVWSFRVRPIIAWEPSPADGIVNVDLDQTLTWEPGQGTLFHIVFFGQDFDEVNEATSSPDMMTTAARDPGVLEPNTTYYWRIDESNGAVTQRGEVWSFTTVPEVAVTDPNLVGWWTFDEGAGMSVLDWSGHGNHGALTGDPQWVDAYYGLGLDLNGDDAVDTGNTANLATWTIATWVSSPAAPAATGGTGPIHREQNYQIDWNHPDETFRGAAAMVADGAWYAASFGALAGNAWYHLAATFDGTSLAAYKNGILITSNTDAVGTPGAETASLKLGQHATAGIFFEGVLDDVRVYDRALSEDEIREAMRGNPLLAGSPSPAPGAVVDVRDATSLTWSAGEAAVSHDAYFGTDRDAVAAAGTDAAEYQGNQATTSLSLVGLVEFGGGTYYWRVDEVAGDGTVQTGTIWNFNVPDYLIVDEFESYTNDVGQRVFEAWVDGVGFTQPEPGNPGNGSGALVGHDIWTGGYTYLMETDDVYAGSQAMPIYYDNTVAPGYSEADHALTPAENWTVEGVTTLLVHFRGEPENTGQLYVKINGTKVPYDGDPADIASGAWVEWPIDLASTGVTLTNVTELTVGIEGGETGVLYIDAIRLTKF